MSTISTALVHDVIITICLISVLTMHKSRSIIMKACAQAYGWSIIGFSHGKHVKLMEKIDTATHIVVHDILIALYWHMKVEPQGPRKVSSLSLLRYCAHYRCSLVQLSRNNTTLPTDNTGKIRIVAFQALAGADAANLRSIRYNSSYVYLRSSSNRGFDDLGRLYAPNLHLAHYYCLSWSH